MVIHTPKKKNVGVLNAGTILFSHHNYAEFIVGLMDDIQNVVIEVCGYYVTKQEKLQGV